MHPGDLTPFGLSVEFLDDGRVLLRIGAMVVALSPQQVATLRQQLGVGAVAVVNDTPFQISWQLRSEPTTRPGGKNYTLTLRTGRDDPRSAFAETLPSNVKRLPTKRKKREKP